MSYKFNILSLVGYIRNQLEHIMSFGESPMSKVKIVLTAVSVLTAFLATSNSVARDNIEVVGSSTVYPFSTVVAERYGRATGKATPKIESTGSGGGMKLFCSGVGTNYPDITNSSRRIKMSEFKNVS